MNENDLKKQIDELTKRVDQLEIICGISNYKNATEYSKQEMGVSAVNEVKQTSSGEYKEGSVTSNEHTYESSRAARRGKSNIENALGKNIMSIAAALLVFVGLAMFALVVLPEMNDTFKQIMMYVASFTAIGFGIYKYHKDESNKWLLAIWACGMGALFISLFVSNLYFMSIGEIPLYILLMIWTIAMCFMSKRKHVVFHIINQVGICVAIYLAAFSIFDNENRNKILLLVIYFLVSEVVSYVSNMKREYKGNIVTLVGITVCLLPLNVVALDSAWSSSNTIYSVVTPTLIIIADLFPMVLSIIYHRVEGIGEKIFWCINNCVLYVLFGILLLAVFCINSPFECVMLILSSLLLMGLTDYFNRSESIYKVCWKAMLALGVIVAINWIRVADGRYIFNLVLAYIFIVCGFYFKFHFNKIYGLLLFAIFCYDDVNEIMLLVSAIVVAVSVVVLSKYRSEHYRGYEKPVTCGLFMLSMCWGVSAIIYNAQIEDSLAMMIILAIVATVNVGISFIPEVMNWPGTGAKEKSMQVMVYLANAFLIIVNLSEMAYGDLKIVFTIMAAVLITINAVRMIKEWKLAGAIYGAAKYVIFIAYAMECFDAPAYLTSVVLIAFAVVVIYLGFTLERKYQISYTKLRIPALVAVLLCILKLMLFDISYVNTILRACSYLLAGVMCFGISYLYNKIDKKFRQEEA